MTQLIVANKGRRHIAQPFARPMLDGSHPLTRGLAFSAFNCASDAAMPIYDYVTRKTGTRVGVKITQTARGTSPAFDGTSSFTATFPFGPMTSGASASVAFWLYWDAFSSGNQTAFSVGGNLDAGGVCGFGMVPNSVGGGILSFIGSGTGSYALNRASRPNLAPGWMHVCMTVDTSLGSLATIQTYINGLRLPPDLANTFTLSNFAWSGTVLNIMQYNASNYAVGAVQNFNVWVGRALNASDVLQHMNAPWNIFLRRPPLASSHNVVNPFEPWTMMPNGWLS